ncbi:MAG: MBL fold metallo-hydrolase [Lysobacterales bacterium]|jgi:glyoxylase-like metal-dependent hydrolase (beta-lactamase superfamily II)
MGNGENYSVREYPGGVLAVDSGYVREQMAACYILETKREVAVIESGTNASTPRLLQVLGRRGWSPNDVRYVIVTHVHLDHAGGAGSLVQACPNATLLVHPRGLRHMVDPVRLEAGSRAVYGDEIFESLYGELVPVPEARARAMQDGDTVRLGSRTLRFIDTPGHARHHFCVHDSLTNGWFTGDTFGLSYREFDTDNGAFMIPTTTPVQFDPAALRASIHRIMETQPDCVYLTHYGRLADVAPLAEKMLEGVDAFAAMGERHEDDPNRTPKIEAAIRDWLLAGLRAHGVAMPDEEILQLLDADIRLNAAGIECWLDYRKRQ